MLIASARTHAGRVRSNNEDAYVCHTDKGVFAVIDGMGGEAAGEVAAAIAAECIGQVSSQPGMAGETLLSAAFQEARRRILAHAESEPEHAKLGAVATAVRLEDDGQTLAVAHVGDTRGYLLGKEGARRLTTDHVAPVPGRKPAVSRDLGRPELPTGWVETRRVPVEPGDLLLLCSDGLSDVVPEEELLQELAGFQRESTSVDAISSRLIGTALSRGGPDNVTVVVVRFTKFKRRKLSKRMGWTLSTAVLLLLLGFVAGALIHARSPTDSLQNVRSTLTLKEETAVPDGTITTIEADGTLQLQTRLTGGSWTLQIGGKTTLDLCELDFSGNLTLNVLDGGSLFVRSCRLQAAHLLITSTALGEVALERTTLFSPDLQLHGAIAEKEVVKLPAPAASEIPPAPPAAPSPGTP